MFADYYEYDEFSVGDRVKITAGMLAGEEAEIVRFDTETDDDWTVILKVDGHAYHVPVTLSMIEFVDENEHEFECGCGKSGFEHEGLPEVPPHGLSSEQTADIVGEFTAFCQSRVLGVGNDQYGEATHQKFEAMSLDELIEYTVEELADIVNYSTFLYVRLSRIRAALENKL